MLFKASAPGSLMLLGEYAVLHGHPALVCAVDKRMRVSLTPRTDHIVEIFSALGHYKTTIHALESIAPFQFVLTTLKHVQPSLKHGCTLTIEAEFSDQIGFGSSAAVTVATLMALSEWLELAYSEMQLIQHARFIIQSVQGMGSGADVAASVSGGVVAYDMQSLTVESIPHMFPLTVIYSGSKTPTVQALQYVRKKFATHPLLFKHIISTIGECAKAGINAAKNNQLNEFGEFMSMQHELLSALGVSNERLNQLVEHLQADKHILGAKISGSGLGDCVIGLGQVANDFSDAAISVSMTTQGVMCEKN